MGNLNEIVIVIVYRYCSNCITCVYPGTRYVYTGGGLIQRVGWIRWEYENITDKSNALFDDHLDFLGGESLLKLVFRGYM